MVLQEADLKELLKTFVAENGITKFSQSWLIKPKADLTEEDFALLNQKLREIGRVAYSAAVNLFLLKERDPQSTHGETELCPTCFQPVKCLNLK